MRIEIQLWRSRRIESRSRENKDLARFVELWQEKQAVGWITAVAPLLVQKVSWDPSPVDRNTDTGGPTRGYGLDETCGTSCHSEIDKTDKDNTCIHLFFDLLHCYRPTSASFILMWIFLFPNREECCQYFLFTVQDDDVLTMWWGCESSDKSVIRFITPIFHPSDFKCR